MPVASTLERQLLNLQRGQGNLKGQKEHHEGKIKDTGVHKGY
jgi:hypothetical protein